MRRGRLGPGLRRGDGEFLRSRPLSRDKLLAVRRDIGDTEMDKPIAAGVAEKLSARETAEFFEERARRADLQAALRVMNRTGGEPPRAGDEVPKGYERRSHKAAN